MRWRVALACTVGFVAPQSARADDDDPTLYETLHYEKSAEPQAFRAVLEEGAALALGTVHTITASTKWTQFERVYAWEPFREKLTGVGVSFDQDSHFIDFMGHPAKGTVYYSLARTNRLGILASLGFATVTSTIWEFVGEPNQDARINDGLVTPLAGFAIGEALFQLGAYFDRQRDSVPARVASAIVAPPKTIHDALDGAKPARCVRDPCGPWHRFTLRAGASVVGQEARDTLGVDADFSLATRIVNLPDWERPGRHSHAWTDGNISSLDFGMALSSTGLTHGTLEARALPFGWYESNVRAAPGGLRGVRAWIGAGVGFEYGAHDWDRDRRRPLDTIAILGGGPSGGVALFLGRVRVEAAVDATADFAGAGAYALPDYVARRGDANLPAVVKREGYSFAAGASIAPVLTLVWGPIELGARAKYDALTAFLGSQDDQDTIQREVPRSEQRSHLTAWLALSPWGHGVHWTFAARRGARVGKMGDVTASREELALSTGLEVRF